MHTPPPHLAASGNARPLILKMAMAGGTVLALVVGLLVYGTLSSEAPTPAPHVSDPTPASSEDGARVSASLWFDDLPSGSRIFVDGDSVGTAPLWMDTVAEGRRHVRILTPDGRVVLDTTVQATEGEIVDIGGLSDEALGRISAYGGGVASLDAGPASPAPVGDIRVTSSPVGSTVVLDGRRAGVTPLSIGGLPPGTYSLSVAQNGFETSARRVLVRPGVRSEVAVDLRPVASLSASPPDATGTLEVLVRPWGDIAIDGTTRERETDVVYRTTLTVGTHRVRVSHPQLGSIEREVVVRPGERERAEFDLTDRGSLTNGL